ncbi:hypothetical protein K437DRAFT_265351 [Tilletiaria anomala UBC 951]|uniref:Uncharacterized protein n=1 Tax=Tilletiaria anomala (strain ATCC 24038 / CBS 436.72 / UBC 951) TaxID=1037660 RepID=A0A066V425_TILAU|nr:uncharacterized protein K437DRAFT_265351 [Tilletiaria anomala UBC 951]KDN36206.1 hypothetical protein K437DRAFT_265351 [Tilletiaria anomala UBC 951]
MRGMLAFAGSLLVMPSPPGTRPRLLRSDRAREILACRDSPSAGGPGREYYFGLHAAYLEDKAAASDARDGAMSASRIAACAKASSAGGAAPKAVLTNSAHGEMLCWPICAALAPLPDVPNAILDGVNIPFTTGRFATYKGLLRPWASRWKLKNRPIALSLAWPIADGWTVELSHLAALRFRLLHTAYRTAGHSVRIGLEKRPYFFPMTLATVTGRPSVVARSGRRSVRPQRHISCVCNTLLVSHKY